MAVAPDVRGDDEPFAAAGAHRLAHQPDVEAMVIDAHDIVHLTPGFDVLRA